MAFQINLPEHIHVFLLRTAGLDISSLSEGSVDRILKRPKLPQTFASRYFLSDNPVPVNITLLSTGVNVKLEITTEDIEVEAKLQEHLTRYSTENNGAAVVDAEHRRHWEQVERILEPYGLDYQDIRAGAVMPRALLEQLMALCEATIFYERDSIRDLFSQRSVAKADRVFAAKWMVKQFEAQRDPCEQTCMQVWDLAVPQVGDDLVRLVQDETRGSSRSPLCMALAKVKHPRAAEVIASVMDQKHMAWAGLQALGKLKAVAQVDRIRRFLRHSDSDVRREAKKALKNLGFPVEKPVPPVHLVKNKKSMPAGLEEWSANLDMDDLKPTLEALGRCLESGFGPTEIAEVIGVSEEMRHNQTKAFCFPVSIAGQKTELWISIFMDDIDSPDMGIFALPEVITKLNAELPERE